MGQPLGEGGLCRAQSAAPGLGQAEPERPETRGFPEKIQAPPPQQSGKHSEGRRQVGVGREARLRRPSLLTESVRFFLKGSREEKGLRKESGAQKEEPHGVFRDRKRPQGGLGSPPGAHLSRLCTAEWRMTSFLYTLV